MTDTERDISDQNPAKAEHALAMRNLVRDELRRAADQGVTVVDLSDLYRDERGLVFKDAIHTLQEAKPVVAQAIFESISPLVSRASSSTAPPQTQTPH